MRVSTNTKFIDFIAPQLRQTSSLGYFVEYFVRDPGTEQFVRFRVKMNSLFKQCEKRSDFYAQVEIINHQLLTKLMGGWTPFDEVKQVKYDDDLFEAFDKFVDVKSKELRYDSLRSYRSIISILKVWLQTTMPCNKFTRRTAVSFLNYLYTERDVSSVTYNTYLKMLKAVFNWLRENCYIEHSPFEKISKKRIDTKIRSTIPREDRARIREWCEQRSKGFLIVCYLVYYSLIRPKEITRLQVKHINFENNYIHLPAEITKCHIERFCAINDELKMLLLQHVNGARKSDYLFASYFVPGAKPTSRKRYVIKWDTMRRELELPMNYQMYSLRDSGITEKIDSGMSLTEVMHAAGHHDLSITSKYIHKANQTEIDSIRSLSPSFT